MVTKLSSSPCLKMDIKRVLQAHTFQNWQAIRVAYQADTAWWYTDSCSLAFKGARPGTMKSGAPSFQ